MHLTYSPFTADVISVYIGVILGVILMYCVCPCLLCLLCGCLLHCLSYCERKYDNRSHPVTQTISSWSCEPTHLAASKRLQFKLAADPELYNAESPPPYPAIECPSLPPDYNTIFPECPIRMEVQDVRTSTDGHFSSVTVEGLSGVGTDEDGSLTTSDSFGGGNN